MRNKKNILLVGQTPPPFHGQAVATKLLFDHEWIDQKIYFLRMNFSQSETEVGRFSFRKVFHLFILIIKTVALLIRRFPCVLYYPPASPHMVPVLRDIFFLIIVRPFSRGTVFHFHAGGLPEFVNSLNNPIRFFAKRAYLKPDLGIEISNSQVKEVDGFYAKKRIVIPNGLDVPAKKCEDKKAENEIKRILFVAGLRRTKGVLDLIETAQKLKEMKLDFIMDVVGLWQESETEKLFHAELSKHNLKDNILIHGKLIGQDKWDLYNSATLFFFPSYYESENFPLVLIEAMAFGLPIVSTKWRGITEMVDQGDSGFLCEVGKCDEFAEAIRSLFVDQDLHDKMSKSARSLYENNYTQNGFISSMAEAFEDVTSNG